MTRFVNNAKVHNYGISNHTQNEKHEAESRKSNSMVKSIVTSRKMTRSSRKFNVYKPKLCEAWYNASCCKIMKKTCFRKRYKNKI